MSELRCVYNMEVGQELNVASQRFHKGQRIAYCHMGHCSAPLVFRDAYDRRRVKRPGC